MAAWSRTALRRNALGMSLRLPVTRLERRPGAPPVPQPQPQPCRWSSFLTNREVTLGLIGGECLFAVPFYGSVKNPPGILACLYHTHEIYSEDRDKAFELLEAYIERESSSGEREEFDRIRGLVPHMQKRLWKASPKEQVWHGYRSLIATQAPLVDI